MSGPPTSADGLYPHGGPCPLCGASLRPLLTSFYCPLEDRHPGPPDAGGVYTYTVAAPAAHTVPVTPSAAVPPGTVGGLHIVNIAQVPAGYVRYDRVTLEVGPSGVGQVTLSWRPPPAGTLHTALLPVSTTACRQTLGQADHVLEMVRTVLALGGTHHWMLYADYGPGKGMGYTGLQVPLAAGIVWNDSWTVVDLPVAS